MFIYVFDVIFFYIFYGIIVFCYVFCFPLVLNTLRPGLNGRLVTAARSQDVRAN